MIEVRDLRFAYAQGDFTVELDEMLIAQGRRVGWIGPSGIGKTTLLHLVAGVFVPRTGLIKTCGQDLTGLPDSARRDFRIANVGLVFQDFALLDYLNVLDNILLPYRINRSLRLNRTARENAREVADGVGLAHLLSRRPPQLSQGERQRVAVCRALITHPKLILADEPTANLDRKNATCVLDAIDSYATSNNATVVVVTHDQDILTRFEETLDISTYCSATEAEPRGTFGHA